MRGLLSVARVGESLDCEAFLRGAPVAATRRGMEPHSESDNFLLDKEMNTLYFMRWAQGEYN